VACLTFVASISFSCSNSDNVFPRSMPYCDVDLTPHWDYDLEKAILLSCNLAESAAAASVASAASNAAGENKGMLIGLGVGLGCVALVLAALAAFFMKKAKKLEAEYVSSKSAVEAKSSCSCIVVFVSIGRRECVSSWCHTNL
jgi:hypothetical protein